MFGPLMTLWDVLWVGMGVYLFTQESWIAGSVFVVLGAMRWVTKLKDPKRMLRQAIEAEGQRQGTTIPQDRAVRHGLLALYARYNRTRRAYPALASVYDDLIASLWLELRGASTVDEWRTLVLRMNAAWPLPWKGHERPVEMSLARAHEAVRIWGETHRA